MPLGTLFAPPVDPPPPRKPRLRERRHACDHLYVRKVKGNLYQLRWWVEAASGGSVNCGLYPTEGEAHAAFRAIAAACATVPLRGKTALSLWAAMKPLVASGVLPGHLLPKYVVPCEGGPGYAARVRLGTGADRRLLVEPGPFACPEDAHRAMVARLGTAARAGAKPAAVRRPVLTLLECLAAA